jgi:Arc/MetJ family transcription regulator
VCAQRTAYFRTDLPALGASYHATDWKAQRTAKRKSQYSAVCAPFRTAVSEPVVAALEYADQAAYSVSILAAQLPSNVATVGSSYKPAVVRAESAAFHPADHAAVPGPKCTAFEPAVVPAVTQAEHSA